MPMTFHETPAATVLPSNKELSITGPEPEEGVESPLGHSSACSWQRSAKHQLPVCLCGHLLCCHLTPEAPGVLGQQTGVLCSR